MDFTDASSSATNFVERPDHTTEMSDDDSDDDVSSDTNQEIYTGDNILDAGCLQGLTWKFVITKDARADWARMPDVWRWATLKMTVDYQTSTSCCICAYMQLWQNLDTSADLLMLHQWNQHIVKVPNSPERVDTNTWCSRIRR